MRRAILLTVLVLGLFALLPMPVEAPPRADTASFWIRNYDPEKNFLRLEPVHPPAFLVQPEVPYPAIAHHEGEVIECSFENVTQDYVPKEGNTVEVMRLNKAYLICGGFRLLISRTLFQPTLP